MVARRRKIQMELAFMTEGRGEAPTATHKGTEASMAKREPEGPALEVLLMEQICQHENLRRALQRVRQNKGGPGIEINQLLNPRGAKSCINDNIAGNILGRAYLIPKSHILFQKRGMLLQVPLKSGYRYLFRRFFFCRGCATCMDSSNH